MKSITISTFIALLTAVASASPALEARIPCADCECPDGNFTPNRVCNRAQLAQGCTTVPNGCDRPLPRSLELEARIPCADCECPDGTFTPNRVCNTAQRAKGCVTVPNDCH